MVASDVAMTVESMFSMNKATARTTGTMRFTARWLSGKNGKVLLSPPDRSHKFVVKAHDLPKLAHIAAYRGWARQHA